MQISRWAKRKLDKHCVYLISFKQQLGQAGYGTKQSNGTVTYFTSYMYWHCLYTQTLILIYLIIPLMFMSY